MTIAILMAIYTCKTYTGMHMCTSNQGVVEYSVVRYEDIVVKHSVINSDRLCTHSL